MPEGTASMKALTMGMLDTFKKQQNHKMETEKNGVRSLRHRGLLEGEWTVEV